MARLKVQVVSARPGKVRAVTVALPEGATVGDALVAAGFDAKQDKIGIFGQAVAPATRVADGDRVELYRPLVVEARQARRLREKQQARRKRKQ